MNEKEKIVKKTKAETNKEIKENVAKDNEKVTRKDKTKAEKSARREAKESRKNANIAEENSRRLSNGLLAVMIFGVIFVMFASAWGYNYFKKEASVEKYIENAGGTEYFANMNIEENKTASLSADGNHLFIKIKDTADDVKTEKKLYKGDNGKVMLQYYSSYFLALIKPDVRGFGVRATCSIEIGGKEVNSVDVKYSEVKEILSKLGVTEEDIIKSANGESSEETTE